MRKAIFIDRDGVLVEDVGYVHKITNFKLIANVVKGLKVLKNYKLFIITNQSGTTFGSKAKKVNRCDCLIQCIGERVNASEHKNLAKPD